METQKGTVKEISEEDLRKRLDAGAQGAPRREPRVDAALAVEIPVANWEQLGRVYTKNISKGGLLFTLGASSLPSTIELTLTLPDGQRLSFPCDVRHVAPVPGTKTFDVGVQFQPLADATKKALEAALGRLGK